MSNVERVCIYLSTSVLTETLSIKCRVALRSVIDVWFLLAWLQAPEKGPLYGDLCLQNSGKTKTTSSTRVCCLLGDQRQSRKYFFIKTPTNHSTVQESGNSAKRIEGTQSFKFIEISNFFILFQNYL